MERRKCEIEQNERKMSVKLIKQSTGEIKEEEIKEENGGKWIIGRRKGRKYKVRTETNDKIVQNKLITKRERGGDNMWGMQKNERKNRVELI